MNESYEQLLKLTETIKKAESLRESIAEKEALIAKLEGINIDYTYEDLPYKKAVDALEKRSNQDTSLQMFRAFFYTFIVALIIGAIPSLIVIGLERMDLMLTAIEDYALYIGLGLSLVVFAVMFKVFMKRIKQRVHKRYKKRVVKRGQKKLLQVKQTAEKMADAYTSQIKDKLRVLRRALEEDFTNLKGHERKLMADALVPEHMLPKLPEIAEYIIDHRAESIKEAINLMVKEAREQFYFERLLYGLRNKEVPLEKVLDKNHDIKETDQAEDVVGPMLQRADDLSQTVPDADVLDFVSVKEEDFIETEETLEDKVKEKSDKLEAFKSEEAVVESQSILEPTAAKKTVQKPLQKQPAKAVSNDKKDKASAPKASPTSHDDDGVELEEEFEIPEASQPLKVAATKPEKVKRKKDKKEKKKDLKKSQDSAKEPSNKENSEKEAWKDST